MENEENICIISDLAYWILSNGIFELGILLENLISRFTKFAEFSTRLNSNFSMKNLEKEIKNIYTILKKTENSVKNIRKKYCFKTEKHILNVKIPQSLGENIANNEINITGEVCTPHEKKTFDSFENENINIIFAHNNNNTLSNYSLLSQPQNESISNIKENMNAISSIGNKFTMRRDNTNNVRLNMNTYATNLSNMDKTSHQPLQVMLLLPYTLIF